MLDYTPVDTPSLKDLSSYITALSGALVDLSPPEIQRFLLQQGGIPADLTDMAGRGGTGTDVNQNGVPDDEETPGANPRVQNGDSRTPKQPQHRSGSNDGRTKIREAQAHRASAGLSK